MEEKIITLETAKLAQRKRFDIECVHFYNEGSGFRLQNDSIIRIGEGVIFEAPTQSLLQKWIRENHKIHITIFSSSQESWMYRITNPGQKLEDGLYGEDFYAYEEALEEALVESLKLIKI